MTEKAPAELVRRGRGDAVSAKGDRSDGLALLEGDHHGSAGCHDRHQAVHHHAGIGGLGAFGLGGSLGLLGGQGDGEMRPWGWAYCSPTTPLSSVVM